MNSDLTDTIRPSSSNTRTSSTHIRYLTQLRSEVRQFSPESSPSTSPDERSTDKAALAHSCASKTCPKYKHTPSFKKYPYTTFQVLSFPQNSCAEDAPVQFASKSLPAMQCTAHVLHGLMSSRQKPLRRHSKRFLYEHIGKLKLSRVRKPQAFVHFKIVHKMIQ